MLAWGIRAHWVGGLVAAAVVSLADLAVRTDLDQNNYGNIFLLMIGGPILGYASGLLKEMAAARTAPNARRRPRRERVWLARVVHDGVLQVLALVQRRGLELGGEAAELGRLAGEQEVALRAFVQRGRPRSRAPRRPAGAERPRAACSSTWRRRWRGSARDGHRVRAGGGRARPGAVAREVVGVVRACLDNVVRHVGDHAAAWVLLEDLGSSLVVSVRDEGTGSRQDGWRRPRTRGGWAWRSRSAAGSPTSGGTAALVTAPGQGTEWEFTLPR